MEILKLKSYVPIGSPLTWIPATNNEPHLRFVPGFCFQYYHKRLGVDFSKEWHVNPVTRYNTILKIKEYLNNIFPEIDDFKPEYDNSTEVTCATISGVHGAMLVPMIYGMEVLYRKDEWPDAKPGCLFSKEHIDKLEPFDLTSNPVVIDLLNQMDLIEEKYGKINGYLNYQGVLNVAFKLRGSDIFFDMVEDTEFAQKFFSHIASTIKDLAKLIQRRQRKSGFDVDLIGASNCVVNMISPKMYEELLLPYDQMLSKEFKYFAVHTCNWNATPYINQFRKISKVGYIDMGADSDLSLFRKTFGEARCNVVMSPVFFRKPLKERCMVIDRIADELCPCDISMGSIDNSVSDEDVKWMYNYIKNHKANQ